MGRKQKHGTQKLKQGVSVGLGAQKWELKTFKRGPNRGLEEKNANVDQKKGASRA